MTDVDTRGLGLVCDLEQTVRTSLTWSRSCVILVVAAVWVIPDQCSALSIDL
ncbi:hypothetical protein [Gordonia araii]|uniref:hypothetical protein n=1 Tax=Gordonia araii TaxID=263909 RepID=UPI00030DF2F6|nr:hypothetical protein [Gordonia araii]NNG97965.1 hypothetical protein [Gordonia araii NBRC 100433]